MHTGKQKQMNASFQASLVNRHIRRFTGPGHGVSVCLWSGTRRLRLSLVRDTASPSVSGPGHGVSVCLWSGTRRLRLSLVRDTASPSVSGPVRLGPDHLGWQICVGAIVSGQLKVPLIRGCHLHRPPAAAAAPVRPGSCWARVRHRLTTSSR